MQKRTLGPEDPSTLESASFLGKLFTEKGKYPEAQELLREI